MRAAMLPILHQYLGRRGVPLLMLGIGKICWGISFIVTPTSGQGLDLLTRYAPLHDWAWIWIVAGVITTASAFLRVGRDWAGFAAAAVPPLIWALAYATAAASGEYMRGIWIFIWYMTSHVGMIMWAASVPEYCVPGEQTDRRRT